MMFGIGNAYLIFVSDASPWMSFTCCLPVQCFSFSWVKRVSPMPSETNQYESSHDDVDDEGCASLDVIICVL